MIITGKTVEGIGWLTGDMVHLLPWELSRDFFHMTQNTGNLKSAKRHRGQLACGVFSAYGCGEILQQAELRGKNIRYGMLCGAACAQQVCGTVSAGGPGAEPLGLRRQKAGGGFSQQGSAVQRPLICKVAGVWTLFPAAAVPAGGPGKRSPVLRLKKFQCGAAHKIALLCIGRAGKCPARWFDACQP